MLVLNQELASNRRSFSGKDHTRKKLQSAQAGQISVQELERCDLDQGEVANFLVQQIPLLRAAANGAKFELLTVLLEELYYALLPKVEKNKIRQHQHIAAAV
jgi:hypothetical protein